MHSKRLARAVAGVVAISVWSGPVVAQSFDLSWHAIASGGGMNSAGGAFTLSGTVGQPDAQSPPVMAGVSFELTGGFWSGASIVCACPGDMNGDGVRDGRDIQQFVACVIAGGACGCADLDNVGGVNSGDVILFVSEVLTGVSCP